MSEPRREPKRHGPYGLTLEGCTCMLTDETVMDLARDLLAAQTRVAELEGIAACAGLLSAEVDAQSERIAELERNRDEGMLMLQVRSERVAELEATLARVRELPGLWRTEGGVDCADCADELEAALPE